MAEKLANIKDSGDIPSVSENELKFEAVLHSMLLKKIRKITYLLCDQKMILWEINIDFSLETGIFFATETNGNIFKIIQQNYKQKYDIIKPRKTYKKSSQRKDEL